MTEQQEPVGYIDYNFRFRVDEEEWKWLQKTFGTKDELITEFLIKCLSQGYVQLKKETIQQLEEDRLKKEAEEQMLRQPAYMRRTRDHAVNPPEPKQKSWDFWKKDE
jgi:hypothetical protein